ncbi:MAG: hypothetical protein M0Q43_10125 [Methanothrix sp.]|nr:hypothetical protein [Methanothrix sp.]
MSLPGSISEGIMARVAGPMGLRFVFQPLVGLLLGIRDGMVDAKAGEPPFIFDLIANRENRTAKLASIFKSLSKTIIIALVLDAIVQYLIFDQVRVTSAIIIALIMLVIPYSLARAITNRILTKRRSIKPVKQ